VKADTKGDTEESASVPAETVPGTAVRVQAGSAEKNAEKNARSAGKNAEKNASRSPEENPDSTIAFARQWVDDAPTGTKSQAAAEHWPRR